MMSDIKIPDKIEKPRSKAWLRLLDQVLALEKSSRAQYQNDRAEHQASMPYMIEPQEQFHTDLITRLLNAYSVKPGSEIPAIKQTDSLEQAYRVAIAIEADIIPQYEKLITGAENRNAIEVLGILLDQTRIHHRMFNHVTGNEGMSER